MELLEATIWYLEVHLIFGGLVGNTLVLTNTPKTGMLARLTNHTTYKKVCKFKLHVPKRKRSILGLHSGEDGNKKEKKSLTL